MFLTFLFVLFSFGGNTCDGCPPPQQTWAEGSFGGAKLFLWLYRNPAKPDERDIVECRLAGVLDVRAPEDSASYKHGAILSELYGTATVYLSYLISSQTLHATPVKFETYQKCKPLTGTKFAPTDCETKQRLVIELWILSSQPQPLDAAFVMLRAGYIYLGRAYHLELAEKLANVYLDAENDARTNRRGIWRHNPEVWRVSEAERVQRPAPRWPVRIK